MTKTKAYFWFDATLNRYRVQFSYSAGFVELIKRSVPPRKRKWHADAKTWSFDREYLNMLVHHANQWFGFVHAPEPEREPEPEVEAPAPGVDGLIIQFFRALPSSARKAAYRTAALKLHPDVGGSAEEMLRLNALWERIEKEFAEMEKPAG
jgi:hypothetical protein